jgi:DUF2075 family protein
MLAYLATKEQFLLDAAGIEDVIREAVRDQLGLTIKKDSSEYRSWQNSLGNAMFHVLNSPSIPSDVGVAIEYRLKGRRQRIDVMLSGFDAVGSRSVAVIELKQWSTILASDLPDHVLTWVGQGDQDLPHPSYQAWSYARLLSDFYEVVTEEPILMSPCAYVHNCVDDSVLRGPAMNELMERAPVFIKGEHLNLRDFIIEAVPRGDGGEGLRRIDESAIAPSKQLVEVLNSMLQGHEEFVLIDEQKTAYESIMEFVSAVPVGQRQSLIVQGGPGTGKSVIAINALVKLLQKGLNVRYVTKNAAPRGVYKAKLQKRSKGADISSLFVSSDAFYDVEKDSYDVLLVDEAHRLVKNSGLYGNLGDNQVAEIIQAARVSVFFVDESQRVTWRDIGTMDEIAGWAQLLDSPLEVQRLSAQFRCAGSDEYLRWVDSVLQLHDHPVTDLAGTDYDVRVVDSPSVLRDLIFERNKVNNTSRLLAGYCWDWVSKKDPTAHDIVFPGTDFAMQWNLTKDGSTWMISPNSVNEVGCIHTCQGLEGDYMGVIIGDDLVVRGGEVVTNPDARASTDRSLRGWKSAMKFDRVGTLAKADELIRNTYRTLLTRGMKGTYIYCSDPETREFLKRELNASRRGATSESEV